MLWISVGRNRKETSWKNTQISWSELTQKLSKGVKTSETFKEYLSFDKPIQAEKKDVGGFVGGALNGGRRLSKNVTSRSLITLDIEGTGVNMNFWEDFCFAYDQAAAIYSTHKHCPEAPRLRLVMPMTREVLADEYQAIARKIAESLGIDLFDPTTFQPERLMYWPSTPRDMELYAVSQEGLWLDPDKILALYKNWKDVSQWAFHSGTDAKIRKHAEKQGDPLEKTGIVGAFCRIYSIVEALESFLGDVYAPTDMEHRYTYIHGSTAAGLIIYEDKFAFSHHGTDPISGRLCNAFDLVRLHKFGNLDDDIKPDTPINRRPSHLAMEAFALKDKMVSKEISLTKLKEAGYDFADVELEEMDWVKLLEKDGKGNVLATTENIYLIICNDPYLKGCFAYNAFENREAAMRDMPWRIIKRSGDFLIDNDEAGLRKYLEKNYKVYTVGKTQDSFKNVMMENNYHPVLDYLKARTWDGIKRLETLFIDYLGADDNLYVRTVTRKAFIAAVARVYQPGIKFDYMLTLAGPQGCGKSTILARLGQNWFSCSLGNVDNDKIVEQLQGVWIMEIAELASIKRADIDRIKNFISTPTDRFRVAYGKRSENFPRQCVFFGTTNRMDFLSDQTGNRRFWVIAVGLEPASKNLWKDLTPGTINQIWAEAVELYKAGEELSLSAEVEEIAKQVQEAHLEKDPREEAISKYLDRALPEDWAKRSLYERRAFLESDEEGTVLRTKVSPIEVFCELFGRLEADASYHNTKFIRDYIGRLPRWVKRVIITHHYGTQRGFYLNDSLD